MFVFMKGDIRQTCLFWLIVLRCLCVSKVASSIRVSIGLPLHFGRVVADTCLL